MGVTLLSNGDLLNLKKANRVGGRDDNAGFWGGGQRRMPFNELQYLVSSER